MKTEATASTLAICVSYALVCLFFSSVAHQTASESADIVRPHGTPWSVMVVMYSLVLPNASGGGGGGGA